jgi:hypothetical protein
MIMSLQQHSLCGGVPGCALKKPIPPLLAATAAAAAAAALAYT